MSVALYQEIRFAIGFAKQADLVTPLGSSQMASLRATHIDLQAQPINEDDAKDLGKGVYPETVFPSHMQAGGRWDGRLTAEAAAIISGFGVGKSGTAGTSYTIHEPTLETDGLDLPVTTALVEIRQGSNAISDKAIIGLACEEFGMQFKTGPGRDNALFTSQWTGTGKFTKPSGITMPDLFSENSLNAGGITELSLVGFDYLANKRFNDVQFQWKNQIRENSKFFPGSGSQSGYQIGGRVRRGAPEIALKSIVECDSGSSEEDALLDQTEGTGVINCQGSTGHFWKVTFHRLRIKTAPLGETDGIASYHVDYTVLRDKTDGVLTIEGGSGISLAL